MALILADRVQETTTTTGTTDFALGGAVTGFQTFSAGIGNSNTCYYSVLLPNTSEWEVGLGTVSSDGLTLARTTVYSSSTGSKVSFSAGQKFVFVTYPAEKSVNLDASGNVSALGTITSGVWNGSTLPVAYGGTGVTTSTGSGDNVLSTNPVLTTPNLGTPSAVTLTNGTGLPLTTGVSGVLPIANGGTNLSSFTSGGVVYASSTSALATGSALTFNGTDLGIGTSSPSAKLHSYAASGTTTTLGKFEAAIGSYTGTSLIAANTLGDSSTYNLFSCITDSDGDAGGPYTKFLVRGDGNVGIGTSSPSYPLTVVSASSSGVGLAINGRSSDNLAGAFWLANNGSTQYGTITASASEFRVTSQSTAVQTFYTNSAERMRVDSAGNLVLKTGSLQEVKTAIAASNIDLSTGNYFTKTISGTTTFTVSNVPTTGTAISFILDITNGGSATVNWWTGVKWAGGTAPTLTASGRDVLGFFTHDGGTTWTGLVLGKDVK